MLLTRRGGIFGVFIVLKNLFIIGTCSLRRTTKLLFQRPSWSEWYIFSVFFVYLLLLKNFPRLKIKYTISKVGCQNEFLKWLIAVQEKMVKKTQFLINSKMVKSFLGRSNSNFGSNQSTSMVAIPQIDPACPPLFKIFVPLPSFLFHPLLGALYCSPYPEANPSCPNPINQPFLV